MIEAGTCAMHMAEAVPQAGPDKLEVGLTARQQY